MPPIPLNEITTQWTNMENLAKDGPAALADFLAVQYFNILAHTLKKNCSKLDDLEAHELASDILFEFIKNDYRAIQRLDRNKGHLRGLFFKIIQSKLSKLKEKYPTKENFDQEISKQGELWIDIYLDIHAILDQLKEERPRLHHPLIAHYFEGKRLSEIAEELSIEENAVKNRLFMGRQWLAKSLEEYQDEE